MTERTSKRVAQIAGRVLASLKDDRTIQAIYGHGGFIDAYICTVGELKALAASALTQAVDKPKPPVRRKVSK